MQMSRRQQLIQLVPEGKVDALGQYNQIWEALNKRKEQLLFKNDSCHHRSHYTLPYMPMSDVDLLITWTSRSQCFKWWQCFRFSLSHLQKEMWCQIIWDNQTNIYWNDWFISIQCCWEQTEWKKVDFWANCNLGSVAYKNYLVSWEKDWLMQKTNHPGCASQK